MLILKRNLRTELLDWLPRGEFQAGSVICSPLEMWSVPPPQEEVARWNMGVNATPRAREAVEEQLGAWGPC